MFFPTLMMHVEYYEDFHLDFSISSLKMMRKINKQTKNPIFLVFRHRVCAAEMTPLIKDNPNTCGVLADF